MGIRALKIIGIVSAVILAVLVLVPALLMLGLFRQSTASFVFWAAGGAAGYELVCEEFEGNILSTSTCRGFSASDDQGVFFRAETIEFGWRFLPVFVGRLSVDHLRLANAALNRSPQSQDDGGAPSIPEWPGITIQVGELAIQRFVVSLPDTPTVCLNGGGRGEVAEPVLLLDMQVMRCAGEGTVAALLNIDNGQIDVDVQATDDGDLAALVLGWDGAGATNIRIVGAGPLESFSGTLDARIENGGTASLDIGTIVAADNAPSGIGIDGAFAFDEGWAPDWAPAAQGTIATQVFFGEQGALRVENGSFIWGNAEIAFALQRSNLGAFTGQLGANIGPYDGAVAFQSVEMALNLQGDADVQTARGEYLLDQLCAGEICAEELAGTLQLSNQDSAIAFSTEGNASALRIVAILDEVIGDAAAFNLIGSYELENNNLNLQGGFQGAQGDLSLDGLLSLADGTSGYAAVGLEIDENAILAGNTIPAALSLSANVTEFAAGGSASGTFGLESDILEAVGRFSLSENQELDVLLETTQGDAELLSALTGYSFSAPPEIRANVTGTTDLPLILLQATIPGLSIGEFALSDASLMLEAAREDAAWAGTALLTSQSTAGNIDLSANLDWPDDAPLEISVSDSQIAEADIAGRFALPPGDAPATASFNIAGNALSPLGVYLAQPASSAGAIDITLQGAREAPILRINLALENISLGEQLGGAALEGNLNYDIAARQAQSSLSLREGENSLSFDMDADLSEETLITLSSLEGNWSDTQLRLLEPANLRLADGVTTLSDAVFAIGDGRAELSGIQNQAGLETHITLVAIPVAPFLEMQGYRDAQGDINANMNVTMTPSNSEGEITLSLDEFAFADISRDLVPADIAASGSWDGTELRINGDIGGLDETPAMFLVSLPLRRTGGGYAVALDENSPLSGSFSGTARAERFVALLPIAEHSLTGLISVSLQLSGTPAEPIFSGEARLQDGTYESFELGTRLEAVNMTLNAGADGALVLEGNASDGGSGAINVTGELSIDENAQPIGNGNVTITNAYMVQRDEYTVRGSGEINFAFPEGEIGAIDGMFRTSEVRIDLGQPLPPGIEDIAVIEINRPAELGALAQVEEATGQDFVSVAALNIAITMPNNVRVQGYGVEAEWQGDISVSGTVGTPAISGEINLVRGFAEFLGRQFVLDEGSVLPDPNAAGGARIAITGSYVQDDLSVEIEISGPAASPEIEWSSVPALPQDEIISRLYFGRSSPQLTAYEAIQLAQLSGALGGLGGGGGVLGFARRVAGLDVLRIEPPENGDLANPSITVGKYVTDRVYIGARRDADTSSSSVEVEVDITSNISAEVETGTNSQAAGINWHWHY